MRANFPIFAGRAPVEFESTKVVSGIFLRMLLPIWIGKKKLPNAAKGALVSTKKTISVPCMVISDR